MSSATARILRVLRKVHLYVGVFIAPALLFFAFTGALQTFSLHETTQGSSYKPAHWIMVLAQIHKKQTDVMPAKKPKASASDSRHADGDAPAPEGAKRHHDDADGSKDAATATATNNTAAPAAKPPTPQKSHLPEKIFFLIVALGLFTSTLSGIYMSYKYNSNKVAVTALLTLGIVVPLLLLKL
jgi:hypothetical protein